MVQPRDRLPVVGGFVAVGLVLGVVFGLVEGWSPQAWQALAAWATAGIAAAAGVIALRQLGEARRLRLEQAQPYVVAYMEPSVADPTFMDLVFRNFGTTAAFDVKIDIQPRPQRAMRVGPMGEGTDLFLPSPIPVLVPGQEWRTLWDDMRDRGNSDLPDRHDAEVSYKDSQGRGPIAFEYVLDWATYRDRGHVVVYGIHHIAKALREIESKLKRRLP